MRPPATATIKLLPPQPSAYPHQVVSSLCFGTSGYAYKAWQGSFYPPNLPLEGRLLHYAGTFGCVELNHTYYRMPNQGALAALCTDVPETFKFAVKAPQIITHHRRLVATQSLCDRFFAATAQLKAHLGAHLFALPAFLQKDLSRLRDFLQGLPHGQRVALDLPHPSWQDDRVYSTLHDHGAALCLNDTDDVAIGSPRQVTADFGYVRLRRTTYTPQDLAHWHAWLAAQHWRQAFVFVQRGAADHGLQGAQTLTRLQHEQGR